MQMIFQLNEIDLFCNENDIFVIVPNIELILGCQLNMFIEINIYINYSRVKLMVKSQNSMILYLIWHYTCIVPVYDLTGTEKNRNNLCTNI